MLLILLRHARSEANARKMYSGGRVYDAPVVQPIEEIKEEARKLRDIFYPVDAIFSSPLLRARQTASIYAQVFEKEFEVEPLIREINLGLLDGLSKKEAREKFKEEYEKRKQDIYWFNGLGMESYAHLEARFHRFIAKLLENFDRNARILAVAHQSILKVSLKVLINKAMEEAYAVKVPNLGYIAYEISSKNRVVASNFLSKI